MKADIVYQFLLQALIIAKTELPDDEIASVLMDMVYITTTAYEDHTGETINPGWFKLELPSGEEEVD